MRIFTSRFGEIEIEAERIITFPAGVPGFEELRRFVLLPEKDMEEFCWLQSVDEPEVAFLLTDPFVFFRDYSLELGEDDVCALELERKEEALVLTVVTIPGNDVRLVTANLLAPVVINTRLGLARQVVQVSSPFTTKHRLFCRDSGKKGCVEAKEEALC
ncbi:MAG: flagellar assembly protein FliW [Peptococcaceae bacterium]|nr:MAG: flagellar assembly protein FliW [Peptococcaceae bacterium]